MVRYVLEALSVKIFAFVLKYFRWRTVPSYKTNVMNDGLPPQLRQPQSWTWQHHLNSSLTIYASTATKGQTLDVWHSPPVVGPMDVQRKNLLLRCSRRIAAGFLGFTEAISGWSMSSAPLKLRYTAGSQNKIFRECWKSSRFFFSILYLLLAW